MRVIRSVVYFLVCKQFMRDARATRLPVIQKGRYAGVLHMCALSVRRDLCRTCLRIFGDLTLTMSKFSSPLPPDVRIFFENHSIMIIFVNFISIAINQII